MQNAATHFVCNNSHYDQVEALFCSLHLSILGRWMHFWLPATKVFHHTGSLTSKEISLLESQPNKLNCLFTSIQHCLLSTNDFSQQLLRQFWGSADSRAGIGKNKTKGSNNTVWGSPWAVEISQYPYQTRLISYELQAEEKESSLC